MRAIWVICPPVLVDAVEELFDDINEIPPSPRLSVSNEDLGVYSVRSDADTILDLLSRLSSVRSLFRVSHRCTPDAIRRVVSLERDGEFCFVL